MAYTETTTRSYGSRVKNSFSGMLFGFVIFIAGTVLLWWNEGNAVKTDKMLNEAQGVCVDMEDVSKVNPEFEGKMVHATAEAVTKDSIDFAAFGVGANAIALSKSVKYYQWVEHKKEQRKDKIGGGEEIITTFTYTKEWVNKPVDSNKFRDPEYTNRFNTPVITTENEKIYASTVTFGAYTLPESMVQSISGSSPAYPQPTDEMLKEWDQSIKIYRAQNNLRLYEEKVDVDAQTMKNIAAQADSAKSDSAKVDSAKVETPATVEPAPELNNKYEATYVHVVDNQLYFGYNPAVPEIGDVIITFDKVDQGTISILAMVEGSSFKKFTAKNGKSLLTVSRGEVSMDQMFQNQHDANTMWTWVLRILGVMLVIGGLKGIFGILTTLLKVLPFLASIMNFGVGLICSVVGFVWSLLVIALAWLFYRPIIGIIILALAGGLIFFYVSKGKKKKAAAEVAE